MTFFKSHPINRLHAEVDRLFEGLWGPQIQRWSTEGVAGNFPAVNAWEDADAYHVEAELPGLSIEDIEIVVRDKELTIAGKMKPIDAKPESVHRNERPRGEFSRELKFPLPINADAVEATLVNGVLTLRLPKAEAAKGRKIEVKMG